MLITNHVLSGALVGRAAGRPGRAVLLGLASHYALDLTPHWGLSVAGRPASQPGQPLAPEVLPVARADGLVGLAAVAAVLWRVRGSRGDLLAVAGGVLGACLPDMDKVGVHFRGRSPYPAVVDRVHASMQVGRESPDRLPREVGSALVLAAVARRLLPTGGRRRAGVRLVRPRTLQG